MEDYLLRDYNVIQDKWLTDETQIVEYFTDAAFEFLECGQGYYTEEASFICNIGEKFYEVYVEAEIASAKQDRGDRLYWVESIENVDYKEIPKPEPKQTVKVNYSIEGNETMMKMLEEFLKENNYNYKEF